MTAVKTVKVVKNKHGNYRAFVGRESLPLGDEEFCALEWLSEKMAQGCIISDSSDFTASDVESFRQACAKIVRK